MGWNIQIYHTVTMCSPQEPPENRDEVTYLGWHPDSGQLNFDLEFWP